uniref:Uncharacterized protein n=1 Tax=Arundo donax TaxID=35708 RepID=A0A0A9MVJ6_ARUDO
MYGTIRALKGLQMQVILELLICSRER